MLKVSASYLEKQKNKSFISKKDIFLAVVNIKTKKLCLLSQFPGKVLVVNKYVDLNAQIEKLFFKGI